MELSRPQLIILADPPDALRVLVGISMVERLLRVVQRLGFREAIIVSSSVDEIAAHLAKPSWARAEVTLSFRPQIAGAVRVNEVATGADRVMIVSAGFYYDAGLLKALAEQTATTLLVDSAPPTECVPFWKDRGVVFSAAALVERDWVSRQDHTAALMDQLSFDAAGGRIETCDAAHQPSYIRGLRKHVRPVFFPAPMPGLAEAAERFANNAAQPDVQAFIERLNAPVEDWIVRRLCRTSVTPNQVTFGAVLLGVAVTALFATGQLWAGVALAYIFEVLDGVDGKLARLKVETTTAGKWEHVTDYFLEMSWWSALAFQFQTRGMGSAWWLLLLLIGSDLIDRLAKRPVKKKLGRHLDDISNFDRFVRCISSRRCINIFILAAGLLLGDPESAFVLICGWMPATAAVHIIRSLQIRFKNPSGSSLPAVTRWRKRRIFLGVLLGLLFVSAAGVAVYLLSNAWKGQLLLAEGYAAVQRGDCEAAISKFDKALRMPLPSIQASYAHANRGYCYSSRTHHEDSLHEYNEAIRLNPKLAWAFEARGLFYDNKKDFEKALQDFSRAIQLDPNAAEALYRRGLILLSRQKVEEAISDFREAIRASPGMAHYHFSLGEAQWLKNDWPAALASFDAAIGIDPRHLPAYRKRAALHEIMGESRKAERDNARAQLVEKRLQGTFEQISATELLREAWWAAETDNHDIAIELYTQLLGTKLSRDTASTAYMNRGNSHLARYDNEKALQDYALASEANPRNAGAYVNRANVALGRREFDAVIAACTEAIQLEPSLGEAYINRALAYGQLAKWAEAVADLEKAIALDGKRLDVACNQLAWIRATSFEKALRNGKEAVKTATRACELTNWKNPRVIDTLAAAYAENSEFEKAVEMQAWALSFDKLPSETRREMEGRLAQFKNREPYRE